MSQLGIHKKFYSIHWFKKKNQIFSFFLILKMAAIYAEIGRVGKLEAGFQQVPIVQNFCNFHIVMVHHGFKIHKEKQKMFSNKTILTIKFTTEIV